MDREKACKAQLEMLKTLKAMSESIAYDSISWKAFSWQTSSFKLDKKHTVYSRL